MILYYYIIDAEAKAEANNITESKETTRIQGDIDETLEAKNGKGTTEENTT